VKKRTLDVQNRKDVENFLERKDFERVLIFVVEKDERL